MEVLKWALVLWLAALLAGVSAIAIYEALFRELSPRAPLRVRAVYYAGQALIFLALALLAGGAFGLGLEGVQRAIR